ncbi:MAG: MGMT family protein [Arthrobacter sp.]
MREDYTEAVLAVAALIPPGRVLAYGDIAELLGSGGPRQVGSVLAGSGDSVPWWRVIRSSGHPPACHGHRAWAHYREEGTPLRGQAEPDGSGYRVNIREARWQPQDREWAVLDDLRHRLSGAATPPNPAMSPGHGEVEA